MTVVRGIGSYRGMCALESTQGTKQAFTDILTRDNNGKTAQTMVVMHEDTATAPTPTIAAVLFDFP